MPSEEANLINDFSVVLRKGNNKEVNVSLKITIQLLVFNSISHSFAVLTREKWS